MDNKAIRGLLERPYHRGDWQLLLSAMFPYGQFLAVPVMFQEDEIHVATDLGRIRLADGRQIQVIEVAIKDERVQLARNRKGIRKIVERYITPGNIDGVLVVFWQPIVSEKWRISLVVKQVFFNDEGQLVKTETPYKRFSYLVGVGEACKTASIRMGEIVHQRTSTLKDLLAAFSVDRLNADFYKEISTWYEWAVDLCEFPDDQEPKEEREQRNALQVIRMITRIMFIWFLRQKGLVPDALFDEAHIRDILVADPKHRDSQGSTYYKAILQNLFFATLNTPRDVDTAGSRKFVNGEYMVHNRYRYERYIRDKESFMALMADIPFLNGGLFECLDREPEEQETKKEIRIDCFSDNPKNEDRLKVPDELFFGEEQVFKSNRPSAKAANGKPVSGLIGILENYQFTIEEQSHDEADVALDPELLGRIFESLLASYNPETQESARKATGSFYTPREVVAYMVEETLSTYFEGELQTWSDSPDSRESAYQTSLGRHNAQASAYLLADSADERKRVLIGLMQKDTYPVELPEAIKDRLIAAIDKLRIIDPACGSGAFPMGILEALVRMLQKLDPGNVKWRTQQLEKAQHDLARAREMRDDILHEKAVEEAEERIEEIKAAFESKDQEVDYARKLFLIENCIFGLDIQPIATTIARLRFFISLLVHQQVNEQAPNRGIRPLPNLETKFVAADSLLKVERELSLRPERIYALEAELQTVRHRHFVARTRRTKLKYRKRDAELRKEIAQVYRDTGFDTQAAEAFSKWDPYNQNKVAGFFDMECMFGMTEGFDVVIGNPPYLQIQKLAGIKRLPGGQAGKAYQELLRSHWNATFAKTSDLYALFYEAGLHLLRPGGLLSYITMNKWMRAAYGISLRRLFATKFEPLQLLDFEMQAIFQNATTYTCILLLRKKNGVNGKWLLNPIFPAVGFKDDFKSGQDTLRSYYQANQVMLEVNPKGDEWRIVPENLAKLRKRIESQGLPLANPQWRLKINRGVLTGLNDAFVLDPEKQELYKVDEWDEASQGLLRPILRGRDLRPWAPAWEGHKILFVPWHFPLHLDSTVNGASDRAERLFRDGYPDAYNYLVSCRPALEARNQAETGIRYEWYALQRWASDYHEDFLLPKLIYPNMTSLMPFAMDTEGFLLNDKAFMMTGEHLPYLTAIFNSALFRFAFGEWFPELQGNAREMRKVIFEKIPIKYPEPIWEGFLTWLTQAIGICKSQTTQSNSSTPLAASSFFERVANAAVFEMYFPDEVQAIDAALRAPLSVLLPDDTAELGWMDVLSVYEECFRYDHPVQRALHRITRHPIMDIITATDNVKLQPPHAHPDD